MRARTGAAQLPLHGGKALKRLVKFGEERVRARLNATEEHGQTQTDPGVSEDDAE